jgi:hypothetical protein
MYPDVDSIEVHRQGAIQFWGDGIGLRGVVLSVAPFSFLNAHQVSPGLAAISPQS